MTDITARVSALRQYMYDRGVQAVIVPTADPHNDEYTPARWTCRAWLTGFTGSAGTALITPSEALLWTDSRYWLQAEEQLRDTPFTLMREGMDGIPSPREWAKAHVHAPEGHTKSEKPLIATEADMLTFAERSEWEQAGFAFYKEKGAVVSPFDSIWQERPSMPAETIYVQDEAYTGATVTEKLDRLRRALTRDGDKRVYLLNDLSDIAWLLNLRGRDIECNPVFLAYLAYDADKDRFTLLTHTDTLTDEAEKAMKAVGVRMAPYDALAKHFGGRTWVVDPSVATVHLETLAAPGTLGGILRGNFTASPHIEFATFPVEMWRAVKTEAEQEGFRRAMERDGVALVQFLHRLERKIARESVSTEMSVDEVLTSLRAGQEGFEQVSFPTIAAYGAHGAIVHYEADEQSNVPLERHSFLLLDSGAQYDCGTTDITRTLALGEPTAEERLVYTLVLKGHLALQRLRFPDGATGLQIDLAARQYMWAEGYDFGHGTGHGVGAHLCVHEGPHQIRKNPRACTAVPLREGMTVTDEPGIYVEGKFGVRIENTLLIRRDRTTPYGTFLKFEPLTLCPYQLRAVDFALLTAEEVDQINDYHRLVRERLLPLIPDADDRQWLEQATAARQTNGAVEE